MQFITFLMFAEAQKDTSINVIVYFMYIGICVVNDTMFIIPHKSIAAQYIQRKGCYCIHPWMFAETAMTAIVHDIKAYG